MDSFFKYNVLLVLLVLGEGVGRLDILDFLGGYLDQRKYRNEFHSRYSVDHCILVLMVI